MFIKNINNLSSSSLIEVIPGLPGLISSKKNIFFHLSTPLHLQALADIFSKFFFEILLLCHMPPFFPILKHAFDLYSTD